MRLLLLLVTCFYALTYSLTGHAIVIRHDKDDSHYQTLAKQYAHSMVYSDNCAGTVIDDYWVVTAAHCANPITQMPLAIRHLDQQYPVAQIIPYPDPNRTGEHDIALLRLSWPLKNAKPAQLYTASDEQGKGVVFVGKGTFGTGITGQQVLDNITRAATNTVKSTDKNWLTFNFDKPPLATALEGVNGTVDSGGPAFITVKDQLFIAGVSCCQEPVITKAGIELQGGYNSTEYYARVSHYSEWIQQQLAKHSTPLKLEHPILTALHNNELTLAKNLLNQNALWQKEPQLISEILLYCFYHGHSDIVALMLAHNSKIKTLQIDGLPLAAYAMKQGNGTVFSLLINAGVDLSYQGFKGQNYLSLLSWQFPANSHHQDYPALLDLLLSKGFDINAVDQRGDGPIHLAGFIGNATRLQILLSKGANINLADNNGTTVLMDMARKGNIELLKLLIDLGADTKLKDTKGRSAWDIAKVHRQTEAMGLLANY
ncbi:MAG: hypothetical protein ACI8WB_004486 [Phenylobacterium sp.]|jgi:hypothetical protein